MKVGGRVIGIRIDEQKMLGKVVVSRHVVVIEVIGGGELKLELHADQAKAYHVGRWIDLEIVPRKER